MQHLRIQSWMCCMFECSVYHCAQFELYQFVINVAACDRLIHWGHNNVYYNTGWIHLSKEMGISFMNVLSVKMSAKQ